MLSMNLAVEVGLANGSLRIIRQVINIINHGIEQPSNESINYHQPDLILVEFYKYSGHVFFPDNPTLVPIVRSTVNKYGGSRSQFPLFGASALTIYKSQGLTLEKVYIDIGPKEFTSGLSFVATSRVKDFQKLYHLL